MEAKHTAGPWYADEGGAIWRRPPAELYQNGGGVAGDKPLATAHAGWHGEGVTGYPAQANARLIAAAPELLEALQLIADTDPIDAALDPQRAVRVARVAIARATQ